MALAFRIPLGNEFEWYEFVGDLVANGGRPEDRRRAADALGRAVSPLNTTLGTYHFRRSVAYRWAKDYAAAATALDLAVYAYASQNSTFTALPYYLRTPATARAYRALALLDAGKPKEALAEAREYLRLAPGEIALVVDLVPAFDRAGAKAEADEVFRTAWGALQGVLKQHPDSALYHNQAAWLAAAARRELDAALDHARKANALSPANPSYQDTLAEVLFRRGDRDGAAAIARKLLRKGQGKDHYHQSQLDRFLKGDVAGPPPEEI